MTEGAKRAGRQDGFELLRSAMVERLRTHYNITDENVLAAMAELPRHRFVPDALIPQAYKDGALPISAGQTISQPFIVARMTELLGLTGSERVLEIGAGTGYQTAVLASLAKQVFAIERLPKLAVDAETRLLTMGLVNVVMKCADGTAGWATYAPYDAILIAAGGPGIPQPLIDQLKIGGRLVMPVGEEERSQKLIRLTRTETGIATEDFGPCAFVPLIGQFGWGESQK